MLGKTNITALQSGVIVTDIADYEWIQQQIGITGNFVKTLFKNEYLVGITLNGIVAYTTDGEVWNTSTPEYDGIKLYDIEWDGSRFLLAGSYLKESTTKPLILSTTDFSDYDFIDVSVMYTVNQYTTLNEIFAVYHQNGKYQLIIKHTYNGAVYLGMFHGDLVSAFDVVVSDQGSSGNNFVEGTFLAAKNLSRMIVYNSHLAGISGSSNNPKIRAVGIDRFVTIKQLAQAQAATIQANIFECKGELYSMALTSGDAYEFLKILDTNETVLMSTGINWMFMDGVYFNECQIFINNHDMLIVRKGESIADKTIDDLVEIAPESSMTCIEKAYGQLFIFGKQGLVLKSTNEVSNEEGIAVQTLSAKQALAQSKRYTDEQVAVLEARVASLEEWRTQQTAATE